MGPDTIDMMYFEEGTLRRKPHTLVWSVLLITELLLLGRLAFGYLSTDTTQPFSYTLYTITDFLAYPFTAIFGTTNAWVLLIAMVGYSILAAGILRVLKTELVPHSRIEYMRALSRKKYTRHQNLLQ